LAVVLPQITTSRLFSTYAWTPVKETGTSPPAIVTFLSSSTPYKSPNPAGLVIAPISVFKPLIAEVQ